MVLLQWIKLPKKQFSEKYLESYFYPQRTHFRRTQVSKWPFPNKLPNIESNPQNWIVFHASDNRRSFRFKKTNFPSPLARHPRWLHRKSIKKRRRLQTWSMGDKRSFHERPQWYVSSVARKKALRRRWNSQTREIITREPSPMIMLSIWIPVPYLHLLDLDSIPSPSAAERRY